MADCHIRDYEQCEHDTCAAISAIDEIDDSGFSAEQITQLDQARGLLVEIISTREVEGQL